MKPESGKKMLRILRAHYEGKPDPQGSFVGDNYQLVDVRPYCAGFADGGAAEQFSAGFNAFAFREGEIYECKMSLHAFDAETATNGSLRVGTKRTDRALAGASAGRVKLDRNPATWEHMAGERWMRGLAFPSPIGHRKDVGCVALCARPHDSWHAGEAAWRPHRCHW